MRAGPLGEARGGPTAVGGCEEQATQPGRQLVSNLAEGQERTRTVAGSGLLVFRGHPLALIDAVSFLETIDRFEGRSTISTWLFGILHHKAQERRRSQTREELADSIDDVFEARFDDRGSWSQPPIQADRLAPSQQTAETLRDCLTALPGQYRDVFHLRQVEELSAAEVGGILGRTVNHVGVLFHRARVPGGERLEAVLMMTCKEVSTLISTEGLATASAFLTSAIVIIMVMGSSGDSWNPARRDTALCRQYQPTRSLPPREVRAPAAASEGRRGAAGRRPRARSEELGSEQRNKRGAYPRAR